MSLSAHPYRYPLSAGVRRHGPAGYGDYRVYRPWLEDEFLFRCVYCLKRQKWARTDIWSVDHLVPQIEAPDRECDYDNLVLACQRCNGRKLAYAVPDPVAVAYGQCLQVDDGTGEVRSLNEDGEILIRTLKLNHSAYVRERSDKLRTLKLLALHEPEEWKHLMGFPEDLPDLKRKRPRDGNSRLKGIEASWHQCRERGELPEVYE